MQDVLNLTQTGKVHTGFQESRSRLFVYLFIYFAQWQYPATCSINTESFTPTVEYTANRIHYIDVSASLKVASVRIIQII